MARTHRHRVTFYTMSTEHDHPQETSAASETCSVLEEGTPSAKISSMLTTQLPGLSWATDKDLRITLAQGSGLYFLDRRPDQVVGRTLFDFFHTDDADFGPIAAHRCALGGQAMNFELLLSDRRFFGLAEPLFDDAGDLAGTIANVLDITDYYRMHQECRELEARLRDQDKVNSLRTFAGGVAHNFNNLLTVMIGYATLARSQLAADSPMMSFLDEIDAAAQTAADLAAQMLSYGQKARIDMQPLNLTRVVDDLQPRFRACLRNDVVLQTDLDDDLPPVQGDRGQLQRLVLTLFFNACEAIGANPGVISLWTRAVSLTAGFCAEIGVEPPLSDGNYVWLQVSDTGCGMDEETQARLFEPFYSTKFTGRGLGLAAAHGIVQQHGGAVAVSSKVGLGTTFHLLLPCAPRPSPPERQVFVFDSQLP